MARPSPIGIIVGGGDLPLFVTEILKHQRRPYYLFPILGTENLMDLSGHPYKAISLGKVDHFLNLLRRQNINQIMFLGYISRSSILKTAFDWKGLRWLWSIVFCLFKDNTVLNTLIQHFEKEGFTVVGIHQVAPDLLMLRGFLTKIKPAKKTQKTIELGVDAALKLGRLDRGQAVVVSGNQVIAVEDKRGTDFLIQNARKKCPKCELILVKTARPQQDLRIDLPTIGLKTIENLVKSGYKGLCLEAGVGILLNRTETVKAADQNKIFVYGYQQRI